MDPSTTKPGAGHPEVDRIVGTRRFFAVLAASLDGDVEQIEIALATLAELGLDEQTLDGFQSTQEDARRAAARCRATVAVLDTRHQQMEDAVNATPEAAKTEFYRDVPSTPSAPQTETAVTPSNPPTAATAVKDPLRVGGKFVLGPGETFAGSASTKDDEGMMVLAAAVDTPTGRVIHVGVPVHDEDKKEWKGAHAQAQETKADPDAAEDDDDATYTVDTNSDTTVIIGAADAAKLPDQVEDVITTATETDKEYRRYAARMDRLYDERMRLEAMRFGDTTDAARKMELDSRESNHTKYQKHRRDHVDECVDRLGPDDRARYDELQHRIDAAGADRFEADRDEQAAEVCGLSVEEYRELLELRKKPWRSWTPAESSRVDELTPDRKPPLLAEQAAIVYGLPLQEYRELEALDKAGPPRPATSWRRASGRTPEQQARYEQLRSSAQGAVGTTAAQTKKLRDRFETYQDVHHRDKLDWAADREQLAELESRARTLDPGDADRLERVIAEHDEVSARCDELGGWASAAVEVPGSNGATLVVEAVQREEEGGVDYKIGCKPPNAAEEWSLGDDRDPYRTTAGGLRKVAKTLAGLAG